MSGPIHILSLGAGVQSSTLALMAAAGEIKQPDAWHRERIAELGGGNIGMQRLREAYGVFDNGECPEITMEPVMPAAAIFADTQAEPASVYVWLDWLEKQLPFPVHRVTKGSLTKTALTMKRTADGKLYSKTDIPFFTRNNDDGSQGKIVNRGCTRDFKLGPLIKKQREIAGIKRGQKTVGVICWIGISLDEVIRMKPSREPWSVNVWPLVEKGMKRHDCVRWLDAHGFPRPPRSACKYCPFRNNFEWRRLKAEEPGEFAEAVQFERDLQHAKAISENFKHTPFLHRSLVPLDQVDLSTDLERGQQSLFGEECEGMCGV